MKRSFQRLGRYLAGGLLLTAFGVATWRVLRHGGDQLVDPDAVVIRFAHWQLEPGVREAFDAIAADYMKLHPKVRVEQMPIPGKAWKQWLRTQLVGGAPPDLIELANYHVSDEMLARYFVPLTPYLEEPNPYDAAAPDLRALSWRKTFSGELIPEEQVHYYSVNLLEYYGVPVAMVTIRIFYNREIVRAALGEDRPPQTYAEFLQLCAALQRYAQRTGKPIMPLAGSVFNTTKLTDTLMSGITQKLGVRIDYAHDLQFTTVQGLVGYLRGDWSLETPAIRRSLEVVGNIGAYMSPGWAQLDREDAMRQFLQGQAAMISTGTWDAGGILQQAKFAVGAFRVPSIDPHDPVYGAGSYGPVSEANTFATAPFGLTQASKNRAQAIDFLRFMTSRSSNTKFAEISTWLPVIKGVPVPAVSEPFRPIEKGFIRGPSVRVLSSTADDIFLQNIYLLSGRNASVDAYIAQTRPIYRTSVPAEMNRLAKVYRDTIRQKDSVMTALFELEKDHGLARGTFDVVAAKQLDVEAQHLQLRRTLADHESAK